MSDCDECADLNMRGFGARCAECLAKLRLSNRIINGLTDEEYAKAKSALGGFDFDAVMQGDTLYYVRK